MAESDGALRQLVAQVAAAYFSNSHVNPSEIPHVVSQIAASLGGVGGAAGPEAGEGGAAAPKLTRAQVRKSISPEALVSFEDNKPYKTLRRHLATRGLTPEQYREKWGLPADYPMVAPNYSAARSQLAKSLGLGQRGQQARRKGQGRGGRRGRSDQAAG
jgi:predicted transcriptional regulator